MGAVSMQSTLGYLRPPRHRLSREEILVLTLSNTPCIWYALPRNFSPLHLPLTCWLQLEVGPFRDMPAPLTGW